MTSIMKNTGELKAESVEERGSAFGFSAKELSVRLCSDSEFAKIFMSEYEVVQEIVKHYKTQEKEKKAKERETVQKEKEEAELTRLKSVIAKIQEKDPDVVLTPEDIKGSDFFEDSTIKYIKEWVKNYRASVKEQKEAVKAEKLAKKEQREAAKAKKAQEKAEKDVATREKLLAQLPKFIEQIDYVPEFDADEQTFAELKELHTRCKMLAQMKKMAESVVNVPDYDDETVDQDTLKYMHARCKMLNQLKKLDVLLDYDNEQDNDALKTLIKDTKSAAE